MTGLLVNPAPPSLEGAAASPAKKAKPLVLHDPIRGRLQRFLAQVRDKTHNLLNRAILEGTTEGKTRSPCGLAKLLMPNAKSDTLSFLILVMCCVSM